MTRKHYQAVADAIGRVAASAALVGYDEGGSARAMNEALEELERFLREDNRAFDPERFRVAVSSAMKRRAVELV